RTRGAHRASAPRKRACRRTPHAADGRSPLAGARQLPDALHDQVPLDASQAIDEQHPVEMIHLVLKGTGQQPAAFALVFLAAAIQSLDDRTVGPHDGGVEAGNAEAPFFLELHSVTLN